MYTCLELEKDHLKVIFSTITEFSRFDILLNLAILACEIKTMVLSFPMIHTNQSVKIGTFSSKITQPGGQNQKLTFVGQIVMFQGNYTKNLELL